MIKCQPSSQHSRRSFSSQIAHWSIFNFMHHGHGENPSEPSSNDNDIVIEYASSKLQRSESDVPWSMVQLILCCLSIICANSESIPVHPPRLHHSHHSHWTQQQPRQSTYGCSPLALHTKIFLWLCVGVAVGVPLGWDYTLHTQL